MSKYLKESINVDLGGRPLKTGYKVNQSTIVTNNMMFYWKSEVYVASKLTGMFLSNGAEWKC